MKYIPRMIADANKIEEAIDSVINSFANRRHEDMGPLLTPQTHAAWQNLRMHVRAGCLCDPPGVHLNIIDEQNDVTIGGEVFMPVKSLRGSFGRFPLSSEAMARHVRAPFNECGLGSHQRRVSTMEPEKDARSIWQ